MKKIQLSYRKIIDSESSGYWDKAVFEATYKELLMQFQYYNSEKQYTSFSDLLQQVPAVEKLHFLVSSAATGYIRQLHGRIPDIKNALGKTCLPFHLFRFEIIDSDIRDRQRHRISIYFYSEPLLWLDTIGAYLLISTGSEKQMQDNNPLETDLVALQPFLSIHSIQYPIHETSLRCNDILS
ncbi:hypothetical protein [Niabella terrae]